jgi:hypothetical protein
VCCRIDVSASLSLRQREFEGLACLKKKKKTAHAVGRSVYSIFVGLSAHIQYQIISIGIVTFKFGREQCFFGKYKLMPKEISLKFLAKNASFCWAQIGWGK